MGKSKKILERVKIVLNTFFCLYLSSVSVCCHGSRVKLKIGLVHPMKMRQFFNFVFYHVPWSVDNNLRELCILRANLNRNFDKSIPTCATGYKILCCCLRISGLDFTVKSSDIVLCRSSKKRKVITQWLIKNCGMDQ